MNLHSVRQNGPLAGALTVMVLLPGCEGTPTGAPPRVAAVEVAPANGAVVPGGILTLRLKAWDEDGRAVRDAIPAWTTPAPGGFVSISGPRVRGQAIGGPDLVRATLDGRSDEARVLVVTSGVPLIDEMLRGIDEFVSVMAEWNSDLIPLNRQNTALLEAKIALLSDPELSSRIVLGRYEHGTASSRRGDVPVGALFVEESMRGSVVAALAQLDRGLPILEDFMGAAIPHSNLRMWYGFGLGSRGGGGRLDVEDSATYASRRSDRMPPHEAVLLHELSHSFMGHESLTQFLELYTYNVVHTGAAEVDRWVHTRGYLPDRQENGGVHAVLDIYRIIGPERMSAVYRALFEIRPPYGEPLTAEARSIFVDHAPEALRARVAEKVERIGT